ncbi:hypothetical protein [Actinomadura alba]|uniref:Uncharacterized protein n=1 Tax=Actinomadura alba TaxID=406431 RepID=A0ABR7LHL6_9ACTN|nr:hypothetical protein [Actinomadura alba]MBC6464261.1 hypothetical protein [Actinomadura alba]
MAEAKQGTQKTTRAATGHTEASKVSGDTDRVAMASRRPDGTPAQAPGFTYIDPAAAREASETQLTEQTVSAVDQVVRAPTEGGEGSEEPDPAVSQIVQAHEQAAGVARARVEDEHGKDTRS